MIEIVKEIIYEKKLPDGSELKAQICRNPCPENPRELYDTLGHIACVKHPPYTQLGDKRVELDEWEDFVNEVKPRSLLHLPLYLDVHDKYRLSTTPPKRLWGFIEIGCIFLFPERLEECEVDFDTPEGRAVMLDRLEEEVIEYDRFINGEVFDIRVFKGSRLINSFGNIIDDMEEIEASARRELELYFNKLRRVLTMQSTEGA